MDEKKLLILQDFVQSRYPEFSVFLTPEIITPYLDLYELKTLKKGELISDYGNQELYFCILLEGVVAGFCFVEETDEEFVYSLQQKGAIVVDWEVQFLGIPSESKYQAVTEVSILKADLKDLKAALKKEDLFEKLYYEFSLTDFARHIYKSKSISRRKAEDRYRALLESDANLIRQVPDKILASYLGITHTSFSRLKRKLKESE